MDKSLRPAIYAIYGFVRYADEIVDTFHEEDKAALLEEFKRETFKAIEAKISLNPVLHAFQATVNRYNMSHDLIHAFLHSMEMDLTRVEYDKKNYGTYIYGSAEVVGLMCLYVFLNGDQKAYNELEQPARHLGAAFQKVNFLRDIKSDYEDRGRIYFPNADFTSFSEKDKTEIEADIQRDFDLALEGIKRLPKTSKWGVFSAYMYYTALFRKIKTKSPSVILEARVRVPDAMKIVLLIKTWFQYKLNLI